MDETEPQFVFMNGLAFVAVVYEKDERSLVADLYRNMQDFTGGAPMERSVKLDICQLSPAQ